MAYTISKGLAYIKLYTQKTSWAFPSLHGGSLEITLTVLLMNLITYKKNGQVDKIKISLIRACALVIILDTFKPSLTRITSN